MKKTSWKIFGTKSVSFFLVIVATVGLIVNCGIRKSETTKTEKDTVSTQWNKSTEFDYSKLIETNSSFDKGFIFVKEYSNGVLAKETLTKNDKGSTSAKTSEKIVYRHFNIYHKYKVTVKEKQKETKKTDNSNLYIGLLSSSLVFVLLYLFLKSKKII